MGAPSKIDRLIELGLNRYGAGDLQGALLMWEEALAMDPGNAQASSYVDYVRLHFELLGSDPEVAEGEEAPFGIQENPEYQIEVAPGELGQRPAQPVLSSDAVEAGWFEEESATHDALSRMATTSDEEPVLELEAELPPSPEVSFDDATREYYGNPTSPVMQSDFADSGGTDSGTKEFQSSRGTESGASEFSEEFTGGFTGEGTPLGFATQETEIRKRDFGFVTPVEPMPAAPQPVTDKPSSPLSIGSAPTIDTISLEDRSEDKHEHKHEDRTQDKTVERRPSSLSLVEEQPDEEDLLATLPNPRRPHVGSQETQDIPLGPLGIAKAVTKELPDSGRRPAKRDSADHSQAEVMMTAAPTQDFHHGKIDIGAPTRELGLRPLAPSKADPIDDDVPTKQSDVRAIREAAARNAGNATPVEPDPEGTSSDIALQFDPIVARSAEILNEVDVNAPAEEAREDQTRRRIAALLERAVQWNAIGETEKAVTAVDLAMSEDPNSALGQKLITRNRETIMGVFQGYLGDLERQPQLARPLHELQDAPISPRAAFLLSRIDGTLTIDELLDVSGMPRLEAYRHLCQLFLRGILR